MSPFREMTKKSTGDVSYPRAMVQTLWMLLASVFGLLMQVFNRAPAQLPTPQTDTSARQAQQIASEQQVPVTTSNEKAPQVASKEQAQTVTSEECCRTNDGANCGCAPKKAPTQAKAAPSDCCKQGGTGSESECCRTNEGSDCGCASKATASEDEQVRVFYATEKGHSHKFAQVPAHLPTPRPSTPPKPNPAQPSLA